MRVYAGTYSGSILLLDATHQQLSLRTQKQISQNSIRTMRISGDELLVGGYDQELRAVSATSGQELRQSKESLGVINCICNLTDRLSAVGLQNGTIRFWDRENWVARKDLRQHKKGVRDIRIDSKGLLMVSIGGKDMIFWNTQTLKSLYHYKFDFELEHLLLVESFQYLFLLGDRSIRQMSTQNNTQLAKLELTQKIQCGLIFRDYLIVATQKGEIKIWSHGNFTHCIHFKAHETRIKDMKWASLDEIDYLFTADSNGDISQWDILQFLKSVDSISQDYPLEGLQPIASQQTKQRIICIEVGSLQAIAAAMTKKEVVQQKGAEKDEGKIQKTNKMIKKQKRIQNKKLANKQKKLKSKKTN